MSRAAWKTRVIRAQRGLCVLCGEPVESTERSWDHLVPQVYSSQHFETHRLGIVFLAHRRCNNARGHAPPDSAVLLRVAEIVNACGAEDQIAAHETIRRALADHHQYVALLERLIETIKRRPNILESAA